MKDDIIPNAASPFGAADLDAEVRRFMTKVWSHRRSRKPVRVADPIAVYHLGGDALREPEPLASATRNPMWAVVVEDGVKAQAMLINDFGGRPSAVAMPEHAQDSLLAAMRLGRGMDPEAELRWLLIDGGSTALWVANGDDVIIPTASNGVPVETLEADAGFIAGLSGATGPAR